MSSNKPSLLGPAPDFELADQTGIVHSLAEYRGTWLVLYFYPKDETPGCVKEACSFRDAREYITELGGTEVVGISADSVESHQKFADKHVLNFTILSDPEHHVIEAYHSWNPKNFFGKTLLGVERNTFIINPDGDIVQEYWGVNPESHVAEIIEDLKKLQSEN